MYLDFQVIARLDSNERKTEMRLRTIGNRLAAHGKLLERQARASRLLEAAGLVDEYTGEEHDDQWYASQVRNEAPEASGVASQSKVTYKSAQHNVSH